MPCVTTARATEFKLTGSLGVEGRFFTEPAANAEQHGHNASLRLEPELYYEWKERGESVLFTPFLRLDQGDRNRTHFDVRDLSWVKAAAEWELRLGVRRVFWGVAESNHLVDVINQTDLVENIDIEDKLGQPMANLALIKPWGTIDLFILPGFRERTFPSRTGRLRTAPRVDTGHATYESPARDNHVNFAVRYSHVIGELDIGIYEFWGTSREPELHLGRSASNELLFIPHYAIIAQTGVDALYTHGSWAWKFESLFRSGQGRDYGAMVAGFEYTLVGVVGSRYDLGLLAEYHVDTRGRHAPQAFNDDLFGGFRVGFNDAADSQLLAGVVTDLHGGGSFYNVEASHRLGDRWKLELEARFFSSHRVTDPLHFVRSDDYVQVELARFF